jgi:hypothetical protein
MTASVTSGEGCISKLLAQICDSFGGLVNLSNFHIYFHPPATIRKNPGHGELSIAQIFTATPKLLPYFYTITAQ